MSSEYVLTQTLFEIDFEHKDDIGLLLKRFERQLFWAINPVSNLDRHSKKSLLTDFCPTVAT